LRVNPDAGNKLHKIIFQLACGKLFGVALENQE